MTEPPFLGPQTLPWGRRLAANLSSVGSLGFFGDYAVDKALVSE